MDLAIKFCKHKNLNVALGQIFSACTISEIFKSIPKVEGKIEIYNQLFLYRRFFTIRRSFTNNY